MEKILVIEDDTLIRESLADLLSAEDYQVVCAENGVIGIGLARKELPNLIICDVMMPGVDGYGVLEALHSEPQTSTTPFIFLTAKADKEDLRQGMVLGADDYIRKTMVGFLAGC